MANIEHEGLLMIMESNSDARWVRPGAAALVAVLLGCTMAMGNGRDPAKTAGPEACGECHKSEVEAWRGTHHYQTFEKMHRKDAAKEIAGKLGIKRMKTAELCMTCHYTTQIKKEKVKSTSGVSCESCHGAAADWINVHNVYGEKGVTKATETPDHRAKRLADSIAGGMIRPENLYDVVANCFQCHTVPHEELVNTGGHTAGSAFELVAWSQGEVRHNYARTNNESNAAAPQAQLRIMYVMGRALDLEFALRGVVKATGGGTYAKSMARRAAAADKHLHAIQAAAPIPEVAAMIAALPRKENGKLKISLKIKKELAAAADEIETQARKFAGANDGSSLSAIDGLLPTAAQFKGTAKP